MHRARWTACIVFLLAAFVAADRLRAADRAPLGAIPAVVADDEADSLFVVAGRLYAQRRFQDAIPLFLRVIEIDSRNGNAYALLGGSYFQLGDYPQAIGAFERAIQLDEGIKLAYIGLVSANYMTQRIADAQLWLLRLIPILSGDEKERYLATLSSQFPALELPGS